METATKAKAKATKATKVKAETAKGANGARAGRPVVQARAAAQRGRRAAASVDDSDESSYARLLEMIEEVAKERAVSPRYDVFDAVSTSLRYAEAAMPLLPRFRKIDAGAPGMSAALELLPGLARALRHIRVQLLAAQSGENEVAIPADLVDEADALKGRMLAVLDYNLGDDVDLAAALAFIRQGQGHQDRINDLRQLAALYEKHARALAKDGARYVAADARRARTTAETMQGLLDAEKVGASARWSELQAKANGLLLATYERVRRTMLVIHDGVGEEAHPTLYAATRALRARPRRPIDGAPEAPTDAVDPRPDEEDEPS